MESDNRKLVLETLDLADLTQAQIIDLLVLLLDDWEIRRAVMRCQNRIQKKSENGSDTQITVSGKKAA